MDYNNDFNFTLGKGINGPVLSAIICLEMILALIGNVFVLIATLCHPPSWKQPSTVFFTSLVLANIMLAVLFMPFTVISTATEHWIFGNTDKQKTNICKFVAFVFWYGVLIITETLAVISIDRWMFIVKPLFYRRFMKPPTAVIITVFVWLLAAVLNTPPFAGLGIFVYVGHGSCLPTWVDQTGYVLYTIVLFGIMVTIITVTSIWTCCFSRKFIQREINFTNNKSNNNNNRSNNNNNKDDTMPPSHHNNIYVTKQRRVVGIFGVLLCINGLCFAPAFIVAFIAAAITLPLPVYAMVLVCFLFMTVASPIAQSYFRQDIKEAMANIIALKCSFRQQRPEVTVRNSTTATAALSTVV